jgi:cytochrome P450
MSLPPGPKPIPVLGDSFKYRKNRLNFLSDCHQKYGEAVTVHFGKIPVFLFSNPEVIKQILILRSQEFISKDAVQNVRFLLGETLSTSNLFESLVKVCCGCMHEQAMLASDGPEHWEQRKAAHPGPMPSEIERYIKIMSGITEEISSDWENLGQIDLADKMQDISLQIVTKTLFGVDTEFDELKESFQFLVDYNLNPFGVLRQIPLNFNFLPYGKYIKSWKKIENFIESILSQSNNESVASGLKKILGSTRMSSEPLRRAKLRHYVFQMLGMGHSTTMTALTFAIGLLSKHPEKAIEIQKEIAQEIGDDKLSFENLKNCRLLEMAILENLRLYPVIWGQARRTVKDTEISSYQIPAGSFVIVSPWVVHRSAENFEQPNEFIPSRFDEYVGGNTFPKPYFPFGLGPHSCIGERFALLEMKVVIATLLKKYSFTLPGDYRLEAVAKSVILRPSRKLIVKIARSTQKIVRKNPQPEMQISKVV